MVYLRETVLIIWKVKYLVLGDKMKPSRAFFIIFLVLLIANTASAATLKVPTQYKTIQTAVNAAHDGDTIQVAKGVYKEAVLIENKNINVYGMTKGGKLKDYPSVRGFELRSNSEGIINGFSVLKNGVDIHDNYNGKVTVRNNYFSKCGISIAGPSYTGHIIQNNKLSGGTISLFDTMNDQVLGNIITKSKIGITLGDGVNAKVAKNTLSYNKIGIRRVRESGQLVKNVMKNNKVDIKNVNM
jgi:parallel beta-helix repeat protein